MQITAKRAGRVVYKDEKGKQKVLLLAPGTNQYPMLNNNDEMVASQLRVLRKLVFVEFHELLPGDKESLEKCDGDRKKAFRMAPSPVGRLVPAKSKEKQPEKRPEKKHVGRHRKADESTSSVTEGSTTSQVDGNVSE